MSRNERLQKRVGQKLAKRVMSQTNFTPNNPSAGQRRKTASPNRNSQQVMMQYHMGFSKESND